MIRRLWRSIPDREMLAFGLGTCVCLGLLDLSLWAMGVDWRAAMHAALDEYDRTH